VPHPEADAEKIARLELENQQLRQEIARLRQEVDRLRRDLDKALRAAKRQAAPFSRGEPKPNPKKPGPQSGPLLWPPGASCGSPPGR